MRTGRSKDPRRKRGLASRGIDPIAMFCDSILPLSERRIIGFGRP